MSDPLTFEEVTEAAAEHGGNFHLLLGNGFSIACRPDSFVYGNLLREADFSDISIDPEGLFGLFGTSDFERVIDALRVASSVSGLYGQTGKTKRMLKDAEALKDALAEVLARKHPENVAEIQESEYISARHFLGNFSGNIYTVNYDLLLYWTLLQQLEPFIKSD